MPLLFRDGKVISRPTVSLGDNRQFTSSTFTCKNQHTRIYSVYKGRMASPSTTQRLLRELKDYTKSPNEALLHLGPVDEDDLLHWEAVLKGVKGTPYEGTSS